MLLLYNVCFFVFFCFFLLFAHAPLSITPIMDLRVVSFNCKNAKSSLVDICSLCDSYDLILLQETWLARSEIDVLRINSAW